ncbi:hypothetical protein H072_6072 [Dactylellina haptotyla CBS 200.50]|uniref:Uncharacterized protein n=1 Tax=Dactylellina haptotyla (strain CBS 200.50) TaxID=1284197 RepID=S8BL20_DACHA|nr:hypothetical protein H072_6072 [Dactylellina haptotyla CBS 200.50]
MDAPRPITPATPADCYSNKLGLLFNSVAFDDFNPAELSPVILPGAFDYTFEAEGEGEAMLDNAVSAVTEIEELVGKGKARAIEDEEEQSGPVVREIRWSRSPPPLRKLRFETPKAGGTIHTEETEQNETQVGVATEELKPADDRTKQKAAQERARMMHELTILEGIYRTINLHARSAAASGLYLSDPYFGEMDTDPANWWYLNFRNKYLNNFFGLPSPWLGYPHSIKTLQTEPYPVIQRPPPTFRVRPPLPHHPNPGSNGTNASEESPLDEFLFSIPPEIFNMAQLRKNRPGTMRPWDYPIVMRDLAYAFLPTLVKTQIIKKMNEVQIASMRTHGITPLADRIESLEYDARDFERNQQWDHALNVRMCVEDYRFGRIGMPIQGTCYMYHEGELVAMVHGQGIDNFLISFLPQTQGPLWREDGNQTPRNRDGYRNVVRAILMAQQQQQAAYYPLSSSYYGG